jgi:toxin ParE1/3/4
VSLRIQRSDYFWADLLRQVDWYRDNVGADVAEGYVNAVEATLQALARIPGLGRPRFADWPGLVGIRSWRVQKPYHRQLIFYRHDRESLMVERVLHGARDLPRRLLQSPYETED